MGLINEVASTLFSKGTEDKTGQMRDFVRRQGSLNAITKMAKSAIQQYPVLISEGVAGNSEDLVYALCQYLETQYSVFTMIAMGLNPIFEGTSPSDHVSTFYSEEYEWNVPDKDAKPDCEIRLLSKSPIKVSAEHLAEYIHSSEASGQSWNDLLKANQGAINGNTPTPGTPTSQQQTPTPSNNPPTTGGKGGKPKKDEDEYDKEGTSKKPLAPAKLDKLQQKIRSSDPTVLNIKFKMAGNTHIIEFPLAVKAMPRFITSIESERIFTYIKEDKPIVRLVKLLSGEIGLFRDIIFQMERAKKDKELYSKLGRHPWFRELIERRNGRRINGLAQMIPFFQMFTKNDSDILPICSLCVTKDEIEQGFSDLWANIKRSNEKVMDKLMLLCLCVVDTTTNVVEFDFYGFKTNTIIRSETLIKENSSGGAEKGKDMEKLLQSLIYKV